VRFCMVTTFYPPFHYGGDATFVRGLSRALVARGHEVEVVHCEDAYRAVGGPPRVAGDADQPAGAYEGAGALLDAMHELGHPFEQIGITGYPESHPLIDDETTIAAMFDKARHATYIASQICFDSRITVAWIDNVWTRGTRLPILVGIPGIVPRAKDYSGSSIGNLPIGQGLAVTPVQMVAAYAAIANGGMLVKPRLVLNDEHPAPRRVMPASISARLRRMLEGVLGPNGTAPEAAVEGYDIAGKTGTAEKPEGGVYSKDKFVASFVGFAPAQDPRLLVAVIVDEPKLVHSGGEVAAPAFEKIASFALPYLGIAPG